MCVVLYNADQCCTCSNQVSVKSSDEWTKTACAGECNDQYSLECPYKQKIAIKDLQYYSKPLSSECPNTACQNLEKCCKYDPYDCRTPFSESKAYDVYKRCSGMQQCGWLQADTMSFTCNNRNHTNYVRASYKCVDDSSFLDMCSNQSLEGDTINLIFNGTHMETSNRQSNRCVCILSTSDCSSIAKLHFRTVDVRLHEASNISKCHPHAKFTITDTNGPRDYKCQTNHFYRQFMDIYYSSSSYARMSMYYEPGVYPAQVWLQVKATLSGQKVVISCGKQSAENPRFCGPVEMIPTTPKTHNPSATVTADDIFEGNGEHTHGPMPTFNADGGGAQSKDRTEWPAIIGGAAAGAIVLLLLIILICIFRRRQSRKRRKAKEHDEETRMVLTGGNIPPPLPLADRYDVHEGNYYETVGATNGKPGGETGSIISPGKIMETFTPGRKQSGQFFPSEVKHPPPPPTPKTNKKTPEIEANPYHMPWDNSNFKTNRAEQRDLAYATSDEIQVLIQRMEQDRRCLNEGAKEEEQVVPNPNFYIHIDDYKIKRSPQKPSGHGEGEESSEDEDGPRVNSRNYEDIHVESDGDTAHLACENPGKTKVNMLKESSNENCCESEDTGYRSVGSPDQVMVSEDDYLIPGSIKSSLSDGSKTGTLQKTEEDAETLTNPRQSEVFETEPDEGSTKF
ncbi:uncharacterized protein LOC110453820 isoform X2 [Mizuhopecten yessoensis]|uniref:uncharacterized protein LOC110453820 isoform X2 n=1 Tax=Mizuhopecten yessoensis TaxID=6573 RepID=UPI000B45F389|nr:uncharacterized protein LOC110453820 isoform X2 [Mizuhopecten yessoensis]